MKKRIWGLLMGAMLFVAVCCVTMAFALSEGIVPVESITVNGLDGIELYPGDKKTITWSASPSNATNQQVWIKDYDGTAFSCTTYGNENKMDIYAYKSGEYTVTLYSLDDPAIEVRATIKILSLDDVQTTALVLDETKTVNITETGTFQMFTFSPPEDGKYCFETTNCNEGYPDLYLCNADM